MEGGVPLVGKSELFDRLAAGHAAGITVLTPNRRLARSLAREFGDLQAARGRRVWDTPDILPFGAFVERLWSDAAFSDRGASVPALLSSTQEQALWEECIRASRPEADLMSVPAAAGECREAWGLLHAWSLRSRIEAAASHEDARTFVAWLARYEKATAERRATDAARLPDLAKPWLKRGTPSLPSLLVAFGFDIVTPQQKAFFEAVEKAGIPVATSRAEPRPSNAARVAFPSARDEIAACARWARARLEQGARRIGIVVPDVARSRSALERQLMDVMAPANRVADAPRRRPPFEISLGTPLDRQPLVHDALLVLRLCGFEIEFEALSRVIRSPFLAKAQSERSARALLDAELRKRSSAVMTIGALQRLAGAGILPRAPILEARMRRLMAFHREQRLGARAPSAWARAFSEALEIAGFPGERPLDSPEYQALAAWHDLLGELATLDRVSRPISYRDAWRRLSDMAKGTIFQPQGWDAPVQVLGILESAGLEFDCLWVMGLTDEAWPLCERAQAFIPIRLQREAGVPQADPEASLQIDRRLTQGWLGCSSEVVVSHALAESDRALVASPLIASVPESTMDALSVPTYERPRDALRRGAALEAVDDRRGPSIAQAAQRHGTSLFRDQSACPFRAFARHRLGSDPLEAPATGLDARERGTLLHCALARVWEVLVDHQRLVSQTRAEREALLADAARHATAELRRRRPEALGGRFGEIERDRLVSHLRAWLDFEAQRDPFTVVANEAKVPLAFGGVEVQARLDRLDRLAAGAHAVIDYKTGEAKIAGWLGPRPDEPQLPMYATGSSERVEALAFAHVKVGKFGFSGLARREGLMPNVHTVEKSGAKEKPRDWDELTAQWRAALEAIGSSYAAGAADVDPKDGPKTCKQCDQQTFCRVSERLPVDVVQEEGGDER